MNFKKNCLELDLLLKMMNHNIGKDDDANFHQMYEDLLKCINPDTPEDIIKHLIKDVKGMYGVSKAKSYLSEIFKNIINEKNMNISTISHITECVELRNNKFAIWRKPKTLSACRFNQIVDYTFLQLIMRLHLEPTRFKKCIRCNNYFYQKTKRLTRYCGIKCANAGRQKIGRAHV